MASPALAAMFEQRVERINAWLSEFEPVQRVADKLRVQPWVVAVAGGLWAAFVLWGSTGELLCAVLGYMYPMYASFRVLEDKDEQQVCSWLKYWVVFAAVMLADSLFYRVLCWIPLYYILRLLLIVWLFSPVTFGADAAYRWLLAPILRTYRSSIDVALDRSAMEFHGTVTGERHERLREAWRKVAVAAPDTGSRVPSKELGLQEVVAQELARGAAEGLLKVAAASATSFLDGPLPSAGARRRVSSPAPVVHHSQVESPETTTLDEEDEQKTED